MRTYLVALCLFCILGAGSAWAGPVLCGGKPVTSSNGNTVMSGGFHVEPDSANSNSNGGANGGNGGGGSNGGGGGGQKDNASEHNGKGGNDGNGGHGRDGSRNSDKGNKNK